MRTIGNRLFGTSKSPFVERSIILCPYYRESTIRGFTVLSEQY